MKFPFILRALLPFALIASAQAAKPPNILFNLADDLGPTDVNAFAEKITGECKYKIDGHSLVPLFEYPAKN